MYASLGCGALSAKGTALRAQCFGVFFVSLSVTLDSAETPFAKNRFSWFLTKRGQQKRDGKKSVTNCRKLSQDVF